MYFHLFFFSLLSETCPFVRPAFSQFPPQVSWLCYCKWMSEG